MPNDKKFPQHWIAEICEYQKKDSPCPIRIVGGYFQKQDGYGGFFFVKYSAIKLLIKKYRPSLMGKDSTAQLKLLGLYDWLSHFQSSHPWPPTFAMKYTFEDVILNDGSKAMPGDIIAWHKPTDCHGPARIFTGVLRKNSIFISNGNRIIGIHEALEHASYYPFGFYKIGFDQARHM